MRFKVIISSSHTVQSAADLQWPELVHLICPEHYDSSGSRIKAVNDNPAIADCFFLSPNTEVFYLSAERCILTILDAV